MKTLIISQLPGSQRLWKVLLIVAIGIALMLITKSCDGYGDGGVI